LNVDEKPENYVHDEDDLTTRTKKFWLDTKVKESYEFYYLKQKDVSSKNLFKILRSLAYNHPDGRTTQELVKDTGLKRHAIHKYCKGLIKSNLVIKEGKFGKYLLTQIALGAPQLEGKLFASKAIDKILSDYSSVSIINKFINRHNMQSENNSIDEVELFIFINKIGMYIAYVLTEAMRTNKCQLSINNNARGKKNTFGSGLDRDKLLKSWVKAAINTDLILWEFSKLRIVGEGLRRNRPEAYELDSPLWSFYEMNDKILFEGLRKALATLNPDIFKELENIRTEQVPKSISDRIERLRRRFEEENKKKKSEKVNI
jgi:hypothetical protein